MGSFGLSWAAIAALAVLTYLRLDSLPMPLPSTLPIGAIDPTKLPRPVPVEGFAPLTLLGDATPAAAAAAASLSPSSSSPSPVVRLFEGRVFGSESVAVAPDGSGDLVMCDRYGYVWRATKNNGGDDEKKKKGAYSLEEAPLAHLGAGRPLGFHFDAEGNLIVCVSGSGLVMLESGAFSRDAKEKEKARVVLLTAAVSPSSSSSSPDDDAAADGDGDDGDGGGGGGIKNKKQKHSPILYANDLDVSSRTGVVYFTDSVAIPPARNARGFWDTMQAYVLSLAQGQPTGRLLRFDPRTRRTDVVADGFWFANGVALSPDETWAAVVETNSLRVYKVFLEGPQRGKKEVLVDGLPGYPDGIARAFTTSGKNVKNGQKKEKGGEQDGFWLALVAPPQPAALALLPWKLGRFLMSWTPEGARPPLKPWGAAVKLRLREEGDDDSSAAGVVDVVGWLLDPEGSSLSSTSAVTDAAEHGGENGRLFFGNLAGDYVSFVDGASEKVEEAAAAEAAKKKKNESGGGGGDKSEL